MKHYLMTTDEHFDQAAGVQPKAAQQTRAPSSMGSQANTEEHEKTPVLPGSAASCGRLPQEKVEDRGLEPLTFWLPAKRSPS